MSELLTIRIQSIGLGEKLFRHRVNGQPRSLARSGRGSFPESCLFRTRGGLLRSDRRRAANRGGNLEFSKWRTGPYPQFSAARNASEFRQQFLGQLRRRLRENIFRSPTRRQLDRLGVHRQHEFLSLAFHQRSRASIRLRAATLAKSSPNPRRARIDSLRRFADSNRAPSCEYLPAENKQPRAKYFSSNR